MRMQDLAQSAMDAVSDGRVKIFPTRYAKGYLDWLGEKRDWPVSRQLWWGHRIPIWYAADSPAKADLQAGLRRVATTWSGSRVTEHEPSWLICAARSMICREDCRAAVQRRSAHDRRRARYLVQLGPVAALDARLAGADAGAGVLLSHQHAGHQPRHHHARGWRGWCSPGLYNVGDVPFREVFIHPKILDGFGEGMSKSKGNGVDPLDVIDKFGADALRFAPGLHDDRHARRADAGRVRMPALPAS